MVQYAGSKWFIHGTKHCKDNHNQFENLQPLCRLTFVVIANLHYEEDSWWKTHLLSQKGVQRQQCLKRSKNVIQHILVDVWKWQGFHMNQWMWIGIQC